MPLEIFEFITSLVRTNPAGTDGQNQGDDHIRGFKKAVQDSFPLIDAPCLFTPVQINSWEARLAALELIKSVGAVQAFAAAPDGAGTEWLLCDGRAVSRTEFAGLFAKIVSTYGVGDGTSTFNLPDYRGEFLRGTDAGVGNDPDAASRTDRGDGTTGDAVGTKQADAFETHLHTVKESVWGDSPFIAPWDPQSGSSPSGNKNDHDTENTGGTETRPRNVNVLFYIHV